MLHFCLEFILRKNLYLAKYARSPHHFNQLGKFLPSKVKLVLNFTRVHFLSFFQYKNVSMKRYTLLWMVLTTRVVNCFHLQLVLPPNILLGIYYVPWLCYTFLFI